ncbi:MAG: GAF domain-containing sensor histidine kinase [Dehalococcoidia bacterium]
MESEAAALARIAADLTVGRPIEETLDAVAAGIVRATTAVGCAVVLLDRATHRPYVAGAHGLPPGHIGALEAAWAAGARSDLTPLSGHARSVVVRNARRMTLDDPLFAPLHPFVRVAAWDKVLVTPVIFRGQARGALHVYFLPDRGPTAAEIAFLGAVADLAAVAVENARLFARARAQAATAERGRLAAFLADVSGALTRGDETATVLERCATALVRQLDIAAARVWTVRPGEALPRVQAVSDAARVWGEATPAAQQVAAGIVRERRAHLAVDANDPTLATVTAARARDIVAYIGLPLQMEDRVAGVLEILARRPLPDETLAVLVSITDAMAQFVERKHAEESLREAYLTLEGRVAERTRELTALLDVSRTVASTLDLHQLLDVILDQLKLLVDYTSASVVTIEDGTTPVFVRHRGPLPPAQQRALDLQTQNLLAFTTVLRRREPLVVPDLEGDSPFARHFRSWTTPAQRRALGYVRSWMGVPLVVRDRAIGLLSLESDRVGYYTDHHASLALALAGQAAVAMENARLYAEAQSAAVLEERQRLARELHDSVTQELFSMTMIAGALPTIIAKNPETAKERARRLYDLARGGLAEMRALLFALRPAALAEEGLVSAVTKYAAGFENQEQVATHVTIEGEGRLPLACEEALYRVMQEALNNVAKHAHAKNVWIALSIGSAETALSVRDDGVGITPAASHRELQGMGMTSMRERVAAFGGSVTVESRPGAGATVRAAIPAQRVPPAARGVADGE